MKRKQQQARFSIAIVGEGFTEWKYFDYIRITRRYFFTLKPELPKHSNYKTVFKKGKELASKAYDLVFCVVDIDTIYNQRKMSEFIKACKSLPKSVIPITSMPCIEFWFYLHLIDYPIFRLYTSYEELYLQLKKKIPDYEKTKKYFDQSDIFSRLEINGGIDRALKNSEAILDGKTNDCSFSEISLVLQQLEACKECKYKNKCLKCCEKLIDNKNNY